MHRRIIRTYRVLKRTVKRLLRLWSRGAKSGQRFARKRPLTTMLLVTGFVITGFTAMPKLQNQTVVNQAAYAPLLETIAKGESSGNYNAYYGHADNQTLRFTTMTIAQVMQWQDDYVRQGSPSSAVGRYQIMRSTLGGLVKQLQIDTQQRYDETMQDRLAIALLERRGSVAYVDQAMSREQFAASISQEWAALPKAMGANPQQSYYAGDGLNQSRVSLEEVFGALDILENNASAK